MFFPSFRIGVPKNNQENLGPDKISCVSYPKNRMYTPSIKAKKSHKRRIRTGSWIRKHEKLFKEAITPYSLNRLFIG